jgi:site-specific DNA recombinase
MPPRLRPVPDVPPRALGLVRVSKEREDMISPELQHTAIRDHCTRRGYQLLEPFIEGIDESGSRRKSKWWGKLDQAVELVEAGSADVIVTWRFDRTARNRLRWATALDRVEMAGGLLESATEPLDTSTASGRFARGMLGEMAAYRAEEIGATWRDVHARRVARGLPTDGRARFGYRIDDDGVNAPDPVTGPVLAELYGRYLGGSRSTRSPTGSTPGGWRRGRGRWCGCGASSTRASPPGSSPCTVSGSRGRMRR